MAEVVAPDHLSPAALAVWDQYAGDLERAGLLTSWDAGLFGLWCCALVRNEEANRRLDIEGVVVEAPVFDRNGQPTGFRSLVSPWFLVWRHTGETAARIGAKFGLSPSDRAGLRVNPVRPPVSTDRF